MSAFYIRYPVQGAVAPGTVVVADQGDPNTPANAWPVKLTDGVIVNTFDANGLLVSASQLGVWNITDITGTVSLPTGAATETTLANLLAKIPFVGQAPSVDSFPVVIASDQSAIPVNQSGPWTVTTNEAGFTKANAPVRNDYTSVNVTTAAYVELVASTTAATKEIEIFDSSGQTLVLATGAAAAEVDQMLIFPGGNGRVKLAIPAATRVSIKAVSATASVGELDINFWG